MFVNLEIFKTVTLATIVVMMSTYAALRITEDKSIYFDSGTKVFRTTGKGNKNG